MRERVNASTDKRMDVTLMDSDGGAIARTQFVLPPDFTSVNIRYPHYLVVKWRIRKPIGMPDLDSFPVVYDAKNGDITNEWRIPLAPISVFAFVEEWRNQCEG